MNSNANNEIPFENNPSLFIKKRSMGDIKITVSDSLKCIIPFFGEITINGIIYYRYACYVMNGMIYYLTLQERLVPKITFKKSSSKLLKFSSNSITRTQIPSINLKTPQDFKTELVIVKIHKKHVEYDLNKLLEHLKSINSIKKNITVQLLNRKIRPINTREEYTDTTYRIDPDGIILSDLQNNDTPFKIIRKSLTNLSRINHPFIFFGEIVIDGIKYYRYACYNSKGVGSFNGGVAFRELVHGRNKRISRIRTNIDAQNIGFLNFFDSSNGSSRPRHRPPHHSSIEMQNVSKKYLYYIPIEEINSTELRRLIKYIDKYRRHENSSFSRTIYNYVKGELHARENNPFALKNNGITNSNL